MLNLSRVMADQLRFLGAISHHCVLSPWSSQATPHFPAHRQDPPHGPQPRAYGFGKGRGSPRSTATILGPLASFADLATAVTWGMRPIFSFCAPFPHRQYCNSLPHFPVDGNCKNLQLKHQKRLTTRRLDRSACSRWKFLPIRLARLWRTPLLAEMRLPAMLKLPDNVRDLREPSAPELSDSLVERRWVDAPMVWGQANRVHH